MAEPSPPRVTPAHALGIYAEPLAHGRRVIVVGDSSDGLGARMLELGARTVHVFDPVADRATRSTSSAARGVSIRALPAGDFDVRDGAFDLALVPDLGEIADPAALLARLRRLVGSDGAALLSARNPESGARAGASRALDYYELYDMVALQFASVRMIGQVPFSGVALAELGEAEGAPQVSVDTQLVTEPDAPEAFIALAGQREVRLDPYAIVQLPTSAMADESTGPTTDRGGADDLAAARVAVAAAQLRSDLLQAQLDEQRTLLTRLAAEEARSARADDLEATLQKNVTKLRESETRAGTEQVRAERLGHDVKTLEEELHKQRDRGLRLSRELEEEKKARTKAELELGVARKNPDLAATRARVSYLEEALRAAEDVVNALQGRVADLEAALAAALTGAQQVALLAVELDAARRAAEAGNEAASQLEAAVVRLEHAERRAVTLERDLVGHGDAHGGELAELEEALRDRARAIKSLEQELLRRERLVQELVAALEESHHDRAPFHEPEQAPASPAVGSDLLAENAALRAKLDALALDAARCEGDAQTSAWRIAELERAIAAAPAMNRGARAREQDAGPATIAPPAESAPPGDLEGQLAAAREELHVLKQALAQEHEARRRSEGGDELTRAHAELQRQAVLIEQLSRELSARDHAPEAQRDA